MLARIKAMLLRCRKNGGDCPCGSECRADAEQSRQSVFAVTVPAPAIVPDPAIVKPGWRRPKPPYSGYELVGDESWPFIDDWATVSDWRRLGIEVV